MGVLVIALIVIVFLWFGSQGVSTYNVKQEGRRSFEEQSRNIDAYKQRMAKEKDFYIDPVTKTIDHNFYGDGSLRHEGDKYYKKGEYRSNSYGYGPLAKKMPDSTKRPPRN